jgi:hypothetical protein
MGHHRMTHEIAKVGVEGSNPFARSNGFNDLDRNRCSVPRLKLAHS